MLHKFSFMNSPVKILTKRGGGETRLLLERDQKRDQAKSTRNINVDFPLERLRWLPLECKVQFWDSLPYPNEFFYPYPQCLYGRSFGRTLMKS